jgi:anti-anti-sigma factor
MADPCSPSSAFGLVEDFGIRCRQRSARDVVLEVVGEVDLCTSSLLLEAARSEFEAGCRALVLDLSGVSFCSARCIATLDEVRLLATAYGATARVARPSAKVRRIADLVRAGDLIDGRATDSRPTPGSSCPECPSTPEADQKEPTRLPSRITTTSARTELTIATTTMSR